MEILVPEKVQYILNQINQAGFEAYVVGGCVRDSLLGRIPNDWDITTSAHPEQVKAIFPKTVDTGLQHGTVTVLHQHEGFEVTTYRIDGEYEDGRHPKSVSFTACLGEDLKRRDFTINAMAYHPKEGLIDLFHGREDMEKGIVRCVGDAGERFTEDALRILRAIRFAAQLNFQIEGQTRQAIVRLADNLQHVSKERIQVELVKLLTSEHPEAIRVGWELGVTRVFLPEFDRMMAQKQHCRYHYTNVGEHTIAVLRQVPPEKCMRLAALLHDVGKPDTYTIDEQGWGHFYGHAEAGERRAREILRRLKFDNHTVDTVCKLVYYHDWLFQVNETAVRHLINKIGIELFPNLLVLMRADVMGKREEMQADVLIQLEQAEQIYQHIVEQNQCINLKSLAVKGSDLIEMGMKPGKQIGVMLQTMLDYVIENPEENKKEILLEHFGFS